MDPHSHAYHGNYKPPSHGEPGSVDHYYNGRRSENARPKPALIIPNIVVSQQQESERQASSPGGSFAQYSQSSDFSDRENLSVTTSSNSSQLSRDRNGPQYVSNVPRRKPVATRNLGEVAANPGSPYDRRPDPWRAHSNEQDPLSPGDDTPGDDHLWPPGIDGDISELTIQSIPKLEPELRESLVQAARQYRAASADDRQANAATTRNVPNQNPDQAQKQHNFVSENDPDSYCCADSQSNAAKRQPGNYYCPGCRTIYYDRCKCWNTERSHLRGVSGHEKTNLATAKWIHDTLTADLQDEEQAMRHLLDNSSLWFGAGFDGEGTAVFRDFGRYASLMSERANAQRKPCFPALVAFVGETGAGKSSLIKLLVSMFAGNSDPKTPVVGITGHADTPTSGDVHLYNDPQTFNSSDPILYADCEGLNGGTRDPIGAMYRQKRATTEARRMQTSSLKKHLRRKHDTSARELTWATTPQKSSRRYFVHNLYPRLLYTFSDVIVFVMKNARVIEDVIEQLITWADAVLEASSNQPVLPHAIIVLNASENTDAALWDVSASTDALLASVSQVLKTNEKVKKYAESWQYRGVHLDSMQSLLLSYYSSVRVIRVPEKTQTSLVYQQVQKLYKEVCDATRQSLEYKANLRMKLSSEEMQPYLQSAFDHFSRTLDRPFDFVQASYAKCNIPSDFSGNILKLAINVMDLWRNQLDGPLLFKHLSFILASCAMVDAVRRGILGGAPGIVSHYIPHFDEALEDFCDRHWPCEFTSRGGRCINVRAGHSKGHQLYDGQIVDTGPYESSFSAASYRRELLDLISIHLQQLLQKLGVTRREHSLPETEAAVRIHREVVLRHFYRQLRGAAKFISHSACLSCLVFPPQHCLPCGHILCTPCVQAYGQKVGLTAYELSECPLHEDAQFSPRWMITLQPIGAGIRILTLDGGGIRGIVELMSLQHIEAELGGQLRVQSFFELIVGTSTGAIIALGIGEKGWTVDEATRKFESLASEVFTRRKRLGDAWFTATNGGKYKTEPLENTLLTQFGDERLFGGSKEQYSRLTSTRTKVAVTTTSIGGTPHVLANYNRLEGGDESGYEFLRAEKPTLEIKTWEAARASAAAPKHFRPYDHVATGKSFVDGGIYHNNPIDIAIREFRLLFPDQDQHPDIVVSLGTAFSKNKIRKSISTPIIQQRGPLSYYKTLLKIANDHVQHSLNSEQTWKDFITRQDGELRPRFCRLNFELKESCPKLDDVARIPELKMAVADMLKERKDEVRHIADRLLATSFYFEPSHPPIKNEDGSLHISGFIECRFPPKSQELIALGDLFLKRHKTYRRSRSSRNHSLCFMVEEDLRGLDAQPHYIEDETIIDMVNQGQFLMDEVTFEIKNPLADVDIHLRFGGEPDYAPNNSISGFPRCWEFDRTRRMKPSLSFSKKRSTAKRTLKPEWSAPIKQVSSTLDAFARQEYPGLATVDDLKQVTLKLSEPKTPDPSTVQSYETAYKEFPPIHEIGSGLTKPGYSQRAELDSVRLDKPNRFLPNIPEHEISRAYPTSLTEDIIHPDRELKAYIPPPPSPPLPPLQYIPYTKITPNSTGVSAISALSRDVSTETSYYPTSQHTVSAYTSPEHITHNPVSDHKAPIAYTSEPRDISGALPSLQSRDEYRPPSPQTYGYSESPPQPYTLDEFHISSFSMFESHRPEPPREESHMLRSNNDARFVAELADTSRISDDKPQHLRDLESSRPRSNRSNQSKETDDMYGPAKRIGPVRPNSGQLQMTLQQKASPDIETKPQIPAESRDAHPHSESENPAPNTFMGWDIASTTKTLYSKFSDYLA